MSREIYTFDKFGQHLLTRNLLTGATKHEFEYSKSLGFGKLLKVGDAIGNKLLLQRDYSHRVQFIENTFGQKYSTKMNNLGKSPLYSTDNFNIFFVVNARFVAN